MKNGVDSGNSKKKQTRWKREEERVVENEWIDNNTGI